jgi:hypothetical protein
MKVYAVLAATLLLIHSVVCDRYTKPSNDVSWPVLYYTDAANQRSNGLDGLYRLLEDKDLTPDARSVVYYNSTSEEYKRFSFYSKLSKTSNCSPTLDKWDCDNCKEILPDGVVVRSFATFPLGITGNIVVSDK